MEMQQIRYFLALCEEMNFTRAARHCRVSQPSLTNGIKALEQELGGPLFHRKPQVALTELGHAVRPAPREIARKAEIARAAGKALARCRLHEPKNIRTSGPINAHRTNR